MKSIKIEVPEGFEIDETTSTFQEIRFKKIESKYPKSVKEIKGRIWSLDSDCVTAMEDNSKILDQLSSEKKANAFLALIQLVELRDAWNETDGSKEWEEGEPNYVIKVYEEEIFQTMNLSERKVLHFRKEKTRDLFMETFKDLIEEAKELI